MTDIIDNEDIKRRIDFLSKERSIKLAQLQHIKEQINQAKVRGIAGAFADFFGGFGSASDLALIQIQQLVAQGNALASEIRNIDFEIANLKAKLSNTQNKHFPYF